jgi:N-acetylmuramoyl-L-alanine amidase
MKYDGNDLHAMALTIWRESRGEGNLGMQAVASVIVNRASAWYEMSSTDPIHATIFQKNQFTSMSVPSDPEFRLQPELDDPQYAFAVSICEATINGRNPDPTKGALYYANLAEATSGWFSRVISGPDGKGTPEHPLCAVIGKQSFYR